MQVFSRYKANGNFVTADSVNITASHLFFLSLSSVDPHYFIKSIPVEFWTKWFISSVADPDPHGSGSGYIVPAKSERAYK